NADGTYSYLLNNADPLVQQLAVGDTLTETFSYALTDADGDVSVQTLTITINGTDDAPVAMADVNAVNEDAALAIAGDVKANDTLGDGTAAQNTITWGVETAAHGAITKNGDGTYSYLLNNADPLVQQLAAGDTLTETFSYALTDADGDVSVQTLTITINGTNDMPVAVADVNAVNEDAALAIAGDVKANDTLGDGTAAQNTITWGVETATYGSITKNGDGTYSYLLNNADPL